MNPVELIKIEIHIKFFRIILENPDNYSNLEALWIEKSILNKSDLNEIKRSNNEISPVNQISLLDKIFNKRLSLYKVQLKFTLLSTLN